MLDWMDIANTLVMDSTFREPVQKDLIKTGILWLSTGRRLNEQNSMTRNNMKALPCFLEFKGLRRALTWLWYVMLQSSIHVFIALFALYQCYAYSVFKIRHVAMESTNTCFCAFKLLRRRIIPSTFITLKSCSSETVCEVKLISPEISTW